MSTSMCRGIFYSILLPHNNIFITILNPKYCRYFGCCGFCLVLYHFNHRFSHTSQPEKTACFKSLELKRKIISHLRDQNFRICEPMVKMVQYCMNFRSYTATTFTCCGYGVRNPDLQVTCFKPYIYS
jgi:hypothetical protein